MSLLSIDMKTKVFQHVPGINIIGLRPSLVRFEQVLAIENLGPEPGAKIKQKHKELIFVTREKGTR